MGKKQLSEIDFLVEQIFNDISYNNGEKINEGWFDDLKANVASKISGAKQGIKNTGQRIANVGRTAKQLGSNVKQAVKGASNVVLGDKEAAKQNLNNIKSVTANNKAINTSAADAASNAKINSYSKSILNTVGAYIKAGGNVEELIAAIQELAQPQDQVQTQPNLSPEEQAGEQMTANAIMNANESYNPHKTSNSQLQMLNSIY